MALYTVSLSDVGQSLLALEEEVANNNASIAYHKAECRKLADKNAALVKLSRELFKLHCPLSYGYSSMESE